MLAASLAAQTQVIVPIGKQARAVVCRQANSEVVVETVRVESPRGREVMIEMAACGVCHSDLSVANGTIPVPPPVILGHEGAGVVVEIGAGGVGLNVIQTCSLNGAAMIVAVDISAEKLATAREFGATHNFNSTDQSNVVKALRALTNGGADYSFECVGRGDIVGQAYGILRKGGKAVVVGVAAPKDTAAIGVMSLTLEERTLTGSYLGSGQPRQDFDRILSLYRGGKLKLDELITRTYRIDEAPAAFRDLIAGRNARGVILF
jgi:Zn-dependent alcohol dehydrogenase